jgi:hypothetical protein
VATWSPIACAYNLRRGGLQPIGVLVLTAACLNRGKAQTRAVKAARQRRSGPDGDVGAGWNLNRSQPDMDGITNGGGVGVVGWPATPRSHALIMDDQAAD